MKKKDHYMSKQIVENQPIQKWAYKIRKLIDESSQKILDVGCEDGTHSSKAIIWTVSCLCQLYRTY